MQPLLAVRNRYLVQRTGRHVGSRTLLGVVFLSGLILAPVTGCVGTLVGDAEGSLWISGLSILVGVSLFLGVLVAAWIAILVSPRDLRRAGQHWLSGDSASAIPLCQKSLRRVF